MVEEWWAINFTGRDLCVFGEGDGSPAAEVRRGNNLRMAHWWHTVSSMNTGNDALKCVSSWPSAAILQQSADTKEKVLLNDLCRSMVYIVQRW